MKNACPQELTLLEQLKAYDTPSVTNVVATYPEDKENCLGLYHPWQGQWYTDERLRCMYPELGRRAGFAVTCVYGLPDPGFTRLSFGDLLRAVDAAPGPAVVIVKQNFPQEIKRKNGLLGGNMMTALRSAGAVGVISDGPSRDVDEVRALGLHYMLTGVAPGHGPFALQAVNVPVEVCSMAVSPGEIVHLDENGAVKFPRQALGDVALRLERLAKVEARRQQMLRETSDVEQLARIMAGLYD